MIGVTEIQELLASEPEPASDSSSEDDLVDSDLVLSDTSSASEDFDQ